MIMAYAKKKTVESARARIRDKLDEIHTKRGAIVAHVNTAVAEVDEEAKGVLEMKHSSAFMKRFSPLMQNLERCHNQLFLLLESMQDEDGSGEDSDSDSSVESLQTTQTGHSLVSQQSSAACSQSGADKSSSAKSSSSRDSHASQDTVVAAENIWKPCVVSEQVSVTLPSQTDTHTQPDVPAADNSHKPHSIPSATSSIPSADYRVLPPLSLNNLNASTSTGGSPVMMDPNVPLTLSLGDNDLACMTGSAVPAVPASPVGDDVSESSLACEVPQQVQPPDEAVARQHLKQTLELMGMKNAMKPAEFEEMLRRTLAMCSSSIGNVAGTMGATASQPAPSSLPQTSPGSVSQQAVYVPTQQKVASQDMQYSTPKVMTPEEAALRNTPRRSTTSLSTNARSADIMTPSQLAAKQQRNAVHRCSTSSLSSTSSTSRPPSIIKQATADSNTTAKPGDVDVGLKDYGAGPPITPMQLTNGSTIEGLVIEINHPWLFWFQPNNPELSILQSKMQTFNTYLQPGEWGYELPCEPKIGMVVCAQFDGDWYRACIIHIKSEVEDSTGERRYLLRVFYLDFGNQKTVTLEHVRPLAGAFAKLPCQVVPCTLDKVGPVRGDKWPEEVPKMFAEMIYNKVVEATVHQVPDCPLIFTQLTAPDVPQTKACSAMQIDIGESLIQTAKARVVSRDVIEIAFNNQWREEKKYEQSLITRYPSFSMMPMCGLIEKAAPTFTNSPKHSVGSRSDNSSVNASQRPQLNYGMSDGRKHGNSSRAHQESGSLDAGKYPSPHPTQCQPPVPAPPAAPHLKEESSSGGQSEIERELTESAAPVQAASPSKRPLRSLHDAPVGRLPSTSSSSSLSSSCRDSPTLRPRPPIHNRNDSAQKYDQPSGHPADADYAQKQSKLYERYNASFRRAPNRSTEPEFISPKSWTINPTTEHDDSGPKLATEYSQTKPAAARAEEHHDIEVSQSSELASNENASEIKFVSPQQRLKGRGLPAKLPLACKFKDEYESWMLKGDGRGSSENKPDEVSSQLELDSELIERVISASAEPCDTSFKNTVHQSRGLVTSNDDVKTQTERPSDEAGKQNSLNDIEQQIPVHNTLEAEGTSDRKDSVSSNMNSGEVECESPAMQDLSDRGSPQAVEETVLESDATDNIPVSVPSEIVPKKNMSLVPETNQTKTEPSPDDMVSSGVPSHIKETDYNKLEVVIPQDGYLNFLMSHIVSPSEFYIHLVREGSGDIVNDLMMRLNKHFSSSSKDIVWQKFYTPCENDMCVARFSEDSKLYRAQILACDEGNAEVCENGECNSTGDRYEVFYVDFGNSEWTSRDQIFPLPPEFHDLPPQALPCSAAEIEPPEDNPENEWSSSASASFEKMTGYEKALSGFVCPECAGRTFSVSLTDSRLSVHIYDTTGVTDIWINQEMLRLGHARSATIDLPPISISTDQPSSVAHGGLSHFHWKTELNAVYVSNLPSGITEEELAAHFGAKGQLELDVQTGKPKIVIYEDKTTGQQKGDAKISYDDVEAAERAVNGCSEKDFKGSMIHVALAQEKVLVGEGTCDSGATCSRDDRRLLWKCPILGCGWSNHHWKERCHLCANACPGNVGAGKVVHGEQDTEGQAVEVAPLEAKYLTAGSGQSEDQIQGAEGGEKCPQLDEDALQLQTWDPMKEDHRSIRNSYLVDTDDPGVATVGYKAQDERRICNFFRKGKDCWRGAHCKFEHVRDPGSVVTTDKVEVVSVNEREHLIQLPEVSSWVAVEISAIYDPDHFYVVFPFGTQPIRQLMSDELNGGVGSYGEETLPEIVARMNAYYTSQHRDLDLTIPALGEILAVKYEPDQNWYRARCIDVDPDNERMKVFYIDYGNVEWVDERLIRKMELQFMHLPFQCVECFLAINAAEGTPRGAWSQEANDFFQEAVDGRVLFAQILDTFLCITGGDAPTFPNKTDQNSSGSHFCCARGAGNTLTVKLYDTSEEEEICIDDLMVSEGYATYPMNHPAKSVSPGSRSISNSSSSSRLQSSSAEPDIVFRPG